MYRLMIKPFFTQMTLIIGIILGGLTAFAADFQKGVQAAEQGDFETAFNEWLPVAEQGDPTAQNNLGWMYNNGKGVLQDYAEAVRWYRKAAKQGDANAQNNLGWMYSNGHSVRSNYVLAYMWYHLSASQGNKLGQNNMDKIAKKMAPWLITDAQNLAKNCIASNYKNCQ